MNANKIFSALIALVAIALAALAVVMWTNETDSSEDSEAAPNNSSATLIRLPQQKRDVAGIRTAIVQRQTLRTTRTLPARFIYDDTRHVAVRAATDGVLESVLVKTGDAVTVGQPIAVLRSPAVGSARSTLLNRKAELELASKQREWESAICAGVEQLAALIRKGESVASIEKQLADATLGDYRGQLLSNYSKVQLASKLSSSIRDVGQTGAVSGRLVQQRESEKQQAQAALEASIEQALFTTRQACQESTAKEAAARRALLIATQTLNTLIGATTGATQDLDVSPNESNLSRLQIVSPLVGTVERKDFSTTERVTAESTLFVIADTTYLCVEADVRERDWSSINVSEGDAVHVTTPAMPDLKIDGHVYFVGRAVDPTSGAIPLVVKVENANQKFRPGLFARVEVPVDEFVDVVVIPQSAVVDLDGQASVFVTEGDGFKPLAIQTGAAADDLVEVRAGLSAGQQVVVSGAFVLKSELLLEGEE